MLNGTNNKKSSLLNRFTAVFVPTVFTITKSKASNFTWLHVSQLKTICAAVKADSHTNNKYINVKGRSTHKGHTRYFFIIWSLRPRTAAFYDLLPSSLHNPIEVREVSCEVLLHTQEKIQWMLHTKWEFNMKAKHFFGSFIFSSQTKINKQSRDWPVEGPTGSWPWSCFQDRLYPPEIRKYTSYLLQHNTDTSIAPTWPAHSNIKSETESNIHSTWQKLFFIANSFLFTHREEVEQHLHLFQLLFHRKPQYLLC